MYAASGAPTTSVSIQTFAIKSEACRGQLGRTMLCSAADDYDSSAFPGSGQV